MSKKGTDTFPRPQPGRRPLGLCLYRLREHLSARFLLIWIAVLLVPATSLAEEGFADETPARLDWSMRMEVGSPVSGVVTRVKVQPGDRVGEGDVLVSLDDRAPKAELARARAQEQRLKLAREEAEREYERTREMYDRALISSRELALAEIDQSMARAAHQGARAELTQARLGLEYSQVKAPMEALVVAQHVHPGQVVQNTLQVQPLLTLAVVQPMVAILEVSSRRAAELEPGTQVRVRVEDQEFQGRVQRVGLEALESDAGSFQAWVAFDPPEDHRLRAGMSAWVVLP
ncbi:efflux RND transporter periplasmic adaptor subunit [Ectothiorhodospira variabilis]|uniref:efflux RND transporter periplasmic adaptor subunit n=1 Tax=Ectothiorhodospira variabilis TaxID=505694 RepID=UPI001EFC236B|nr:efflux RND transporter periplasmic adaptor subunit [Ectothiorhodospira variabilis]MCG5497621.1 efflux RND transporter periplasmic adaptor subunit [Ectothiorhodospira variabilis]